MKPITLTMLQVVRIAIMLDGSQGQRKDLRVLQDIRKRLDINDEELALLVKPIQGGFAISNEVQSMQPREIQLAPEEIRRLIEVLDAQTFTVRDMAWVDPMVAGLTSLA